MTVTVDHAGFRSWARKAPPVGIIVHDTAGRSWSGSRAWMLKQGTGTHFAVLLNGCVLEVAYPGIAVAHAGRWNATTIGVDLQNPMRSSRMTADEEARLVSVPWAPKGQMIGWTEAQHVALEELLIELCDRYGIRRAVCGDLRAQAKARLKDGTAPAPGWSGVLAHGQVSKERWDGILAPHRLRFRDGWEVL